MTCAEIIKDYGLPTVTIIATLFASVIGALVGGWFALEGADKAHKQNHERDKNERQEKINGVLRAIKCELDILGVIYMDNIGKIIDGLQESKALRVRLSLKNRYFIVYPENTDIVGQIKDETLVNSIIVTYNTANALIDALWVNNEIIEEENEAKKQLKAEHKLDARFPSTIRTLGNFTERLEVQGQFIKNLHNALIWEKLKVVELINLYIAENPPKEIVWMDTTSKLIVHWKKFLDWLRGIWARITKELYQ